jgi:hypothetical protein
VNCFWIFHEVELGYASTRETCCVLEGSASTGWRDSTKQSRLTEITELGCMIQLIILIRRRNVGVERRHCDGWGGD